MISEKVRGWLISHPCRMLTLAVCLALAPFLGKPFNIDDPLFLWAAKHIQAHPGNPYDFNVNWSWGDMPMSRMTDNPPLTCYYIAAVAAVFGWSEWALHAAFLLPAVLVILGTWRLAKNFCRSPVFVALITLFTPVFLISADTVMCDVCMLAFWVWAVVFWVEGLSAGSCRKLAVAGVLMALAEMTKYYGACLLPLLAVHAVVRRRPLKTWGQFLIIPAGVLCLYQYVTQAVYGESLLLRAMNFTSYYKNYIGNSHLQGGVFGLTFMGGCLAPVVFFAPWLARKRGLALLGVAALAVGAVIFFAAALGSNYLGMTVWVKIQMLFWAAAGMGILLLAAENVWRRRDANAVLLLFWVGGTFVFAAFFNWTVNARSILPMTPAVAILVVQRLEDFQGAITNGMRVALGLCALLALLAVCGDFSEAVAVRESVDEVLQKYARAGGTLWYQGHWGFQYYLDDAGAKAMDFRHLALYPGDHVALAPYNMTAHPPDPAISDLADVITVPVPGWLATWNPRMGAGFYASVRGPLPFVFGPVLPEIVYVYQMKSSAESSAPKAQ